MSCTFPSFPSTHGSQSPRFSIAEEAGKLSEAAAAPLSDADKTKAAVAAALAATVNGELLAGDVPIDENLFDDDDLDDIDDELETLDLDDEWRHYDVIEK